MIRGDNYDVYCGLDRGVNCDLVRNDNYGVYSGLLWGVNCVVARSLSRCCWRYSFYCFRVLVEVVIVAMFVLLIGMLNVVLFVVLIVFFCCSLYGVNCGGTRSLSRDFIEGEEGVDRSSTGITCKSTRRQR